jgi:hypothetical protein
MNPRDLDPLLSELLDLARLAAMKAGTELPDELAVASEFETDPSKTLRALVARTRKAVASL